MLAGYGEGGVGCRVDGKAGGQRQPDGGSLAHERHRQGGEGSCIEDSLSQTVYMMKTWYWQYSCWRTRRTS